MYIKIQDVKKQYNKFNVKNRENICLFGVCAGCKKIHYFSKDEFKPNLMPIYTQLMLEHGKIRMIDYYDYGFEREMDLYKVLDEKDINIKHIHDVIQEKKLYWIKRYPHSRKLHVFITNSKTQ